MKPVDAHCHIDFDQFDEDREEVLEKSRENLEFIVNAGSNLEHNRNAVKLQEENPEFIISNLGLHPVYTDSFKELEEIKEQIREENPSAIGEIGLDHHHVKNRDIREVFREMLELAENMNKPVVVHSRDAERKAVQILKEYSLPGVMLHCFNGKPELAVDAVDSGMKIGITTQVLYSERVQKIAEKLKLEYILLETDSPYLYRGERNEPANVVESAEKIAEIKNVEKDKVVNRTTENARELFK